MYRVFSILTLALGLGITQAQQTYSNYFTLTDPFGMNPAQVQNAFLRTEPFGTPVRYWQPSTPNAWAEVVYQFDSPFVIGSGRMFMSISAYNSGSPANFDSGAEAYLDISTDGIHYSNIFGAYGDYGGGGAAGPGDITSYVEGAETVYVRSRLFMTTDGGSYGTAQFLRGDPGALFGLDLTEVPEPGILSVLGVGFVVMRRRSLRDHRG